MLNGLIFVLIRLLNCVIYYEKNKQLSWYDNSSYKWDKRKFFCVLVSDCGEQNTWIKEMAVFLFGYYNTIKMYFGFVCSWVMRISVSYRTC